MFLCQLVSETLIGNKRAVWSHEPDQLMMSVQLHIKLHQNQNRAETSPTVYLFIVNLKN